MVVVRYTEEVKERCTILRRCFPFPTTDGPYPLPTSLPPHPFGDHISIPSHSFTITVLTDSIPLPLSFIPHSRHIPQIRKKTLLPVMDPNSTGKFWSEFACCWIFVNPLTIGGSGHGVVVVVAERRLVESGVLFGLVPHRLHRLVLVTC